MSTIDPRSVTVGPDTFQFTPKIAEAAMAIIAKYPPAFKASAVIPLLDLAQRQNDGWLPRAAMDYVAGMLGMPPIRVYEVATFYTMFILQPIGKHHVRVCTNVPCWLAGSDRVLATCRKSLGIDLGETSADGQFSLAETECLGACVNGPMIWIGDDYYEDLDSENTERILETLKNGGTPKPGPQSGRKSCEPRGGLTTLLEPAAPAPGASKGSA
ncbi:MAG: NADH-quinone oxidoreductase subunit NuoE [Rhodospirillales bacterium]|nr:NADH-quinone oxidoreductase subunit NuoE [Rhodospirillales bacterium]